MRGLALAALLCMLLTGCAAGAPDYQVRIDVVDGAEPLGYGHGILIDSRHVVTVYHVADKQRDYRVSRASLHAGAHRRIRYVKARLLGHFNEGVSTEPLAVLKLEKPMWCPRFPKFRNVEPGDSGSPILGKRGEVVGLVTGHGGLVYWNRAPRVNPLMGTNGPVGPVPRKFRRKKK